MVLGIAYTFRVWILKKRFFVSKSSSSLYSWWRPAPSSRSSLSVLTAVKYVKHPPMWMTTALKSSKLPFTKRNWFLLIEVDFSSIYTVSHCKKLTYFTVFYKLKLVFASRYRIFWTKRLISRQSPNEVVLLPVPVYLLDNTGQRWPFL